jgi:DNA end-binding protein Ku
LVQKDPVRSLVPLDESSAEAYNVIQEAMRRTNRIGLGGVVMNGRERLMAIEARESGLLATTLRMRDEVRNTSDALTLVPHGKPDKQMIAIAEQIIAQKEGPFEPEQFVDRYEEALRALIEEKKRGHKIVQSKEPEDTDNVVDLMEALRKSLQGKANTPKPRGTATVSTLKRKR